MPSGTPGSVCPFRPPAPPKPIPRCLEQHRSVILHDSCDPEWSQRPHFLDSLKPRADVGLIDEKSGLKTARPQVGYLFSGPACQSQPLRGQSAAVAHLAQGREGIGAQPVQPDPLGVMDVPKWWWLIAQD